MSIEVQETELKNGLERGRYQAVPFRWRADRTAERLRERWDRVVMVGSFSVVAALRSGSTVQSDNEGRERVVGQAQAAGVWVSWRSDRGRHGTVER